jgi:hypothetical protein
MTTNGIQIFSNYGSEKPEAELALTTGLEQKSLFDNPPNDADDTGWAPDSLAETVGRPIKNSKEQ